MDDWKIPKPKPPKQKLDLAEAVLEELPRTVIPKDAIWRRATDAEAEQMEAALQAQPVRLRRIYEGATFISTEDELYGVLEAALVQMFGAERAAELLEPPASEPKPAPSGAHRRAADPVRG